MDLTVGRTVGPTVDSTVGWMWNCWIDSQIV